MPKLRNVDFLFQPKRHATIDFKLAREFALAANCCDAIELNSLSLPALDEYNRAIAAEREA